MTFENDTNAVMTALLTHEDDLIYDQLLDELENPVDVLIAIAMALREFAEHMDEEMNEYLRSKGETPQTLAELWAESLLEVEAEG